MVEAVETAVEVVPEKPEVVEPPIAALAVKPEETVEDKPVIHDAGAFKAVAEVPKPELATEKSSKGSLDRDIALAKVDEDKRLSIVKAWEDNEKTKAENKAEKKFSEVNSWENSRRAALETKLKKYDEELEKKRAECAERVKNKLAVIHKQAEEKRAIVLAIRGEETLKAEELAAKFRIAGHVPPKAWGCLGA